MEDGYTIDYKAMFENLLSKMKDRCSIEDEYFELIRNVNASQETTSIICKNFMNMPIADQVIYLRAVNNMCNVCAYLQEKHKFTV